MHRPLSFAALWHDTLADTRALMPLALPVAAAFVLLPAVAIDLFGPPLPSLPIAGATAIVGPPTLPARPATDGASAAPRAGATSQELPVRLMPPQQWPTRFIVIAFVLPALIGLIAQLTIIRLALDRRRGLQRSVGEALTAAVRVWPLAIAALLFSAMPIAVGMLALVVPGIYLAGRLTPAVALVVDGVGPVAAIEQSWALTEGNGWRVIGFTLLFVGWFFVVGAAGGAIGAGAAAMLRTAGAAGAGAVVASTIDGLIAALFTVVNAVAVATVYRTLRA